jgi:hypothetical protein
METKSKRTKVPLAKVKIDGDTQSRVKISTDTVSAYVDDLDKLPPADLFFDGADYWLADGFHRYHAASKAGRTSIDANVHTGDRRDAVLFSVGANATHGLRRTNADKRKAVMTLLGDDEWSRWSDRKIADKCGVSHTFVSATREELKTPETNDEAEDESGNRCHSNVDSDSATAISDAEASDEEEQSDADTTPSVKDELGTVLPTPDIRAAFELRKEFKLVLAALAQVKKSIRGLLNTPAGAFMDEQDIEDRTRDVRHLVTFALPYAVCPFCNGNKCKACKQSGWMPEKVYEQLKGAAK